MDFQIRLAGRIIAIQTIYPDTLAMCKDYLAEGTPEIVVRTTQQDIDNECRKSDQERVLEGLPPYRFSDGYLETLAVYRQIACAMLDFDTLLFHGSAIAVDGVAYLFTAKSGTGKSTHTRFWRQTFGDRAVMVNDDKPLVKITPEGVFVCGTPWDGKHRLSTNCTVPLKAICVLNRGEENVIRPVDRQAVWPMLFQQSYRPSDPAKLKRVLELVDRLSGAVELFELFCNLDPAAAQVAFDGMQGRQG